ncbi:hypothetical protein, partial [Phenylobacterium sp.]|uniref:hypothetical protein n=1 Tax=Phenylobacterium sp. TaxID=1871053 RepID=UPI0025DBA61B
LRRKFAALEIQKTQLFQLRDFACLSGRAMRGRKSALTVDFFNSLLERLAVRIEGLGYEVPPQAGELQ